VEAQHINKSLSALGDVMAALADKDRKHVPYRNSKLTQLLEKSLSGSAKVMMFVHIAPEEASYCESVTTMKFATRVSEITLGKVRGRPPCCDGCHERGRQAVQPRCWWPGPRRSPPPPPPPPAGQAQRREQQGV
jgi:hypothetical protein